MRAAALVVVVALACRRADPPPSLAGFEQAALGVTLPGIASVDGLHPPEVLPRLILSRTEARFDNAAYLQTRRSGRREGPAQPDRVGLVPPFGADPRSMVPLLEAMNHARRDQARARREVTAIVVRADQATPPTVFDPVFRTARQAGVAELQVMVVVEGHEVAFPVRVALGDPPSPMDQGRCAQVDIQLAPAGVFVSAALPGEPFRHELVGPEGRCPAVAARDGRVDPADLPALLRALVAQMPMCPEPRLAVAAGSTWGDLVRALAGLRGIAGAERVGLSPARPHPCYPAMSVTDLRRHFDLAVGATPDAGAARAPDAGP